MKYTTRRRLFLPLGSNVEQVGDISCS